ncbi:DUF1775 domain-containing protein [Aeromicrobium phragmitis]|uniref:DUF1775 domain-containing protein n=1 Tax=Aeromicrobium phragmitis TaxID=2478914 RepID=A0A3L8PPS1_9ACTN|nr:DUF1775 domain-containing protein [Aeromicrobium phragmitis]RLV57184.1 DUF1775 domain-containing protein [Aeromicrobium phragmitis]
MRRLVIIGALSAALTLVAAPASAHVLVDAVDPEGNGSVTVTFSFDHGCDGSPTTALAVSMPEGAQIVGDEFGAPDGWTATADDGTIRWSGPGIADGDTAQFTAQLRLSGAPGTTLLFPSEQECENGEGYAWTGSADDDPEPAPRFVATAATLDPDLAPASQTPAETSGAGTLAVAGAVVIATVAGAAALQVSGGSGRKPGPRGRRPASRR